MYTSKKSTYISKKRTPSDIITDSITNNKIDRSKANLIKDIATICVEDTKYQEINLTQQLEKDIDNGVRQLKTIESHKLWEIKKSFNKRKL